MTDLIKPKMDLVFQQLSELTSSVWRSEKVSSYGSDTNYFTYIKGQKVSIRIISQGKNKVKALLSLGIYRLDNCFYKSISFSILKSESAIFKDLCKRLEINLLNSKIEQILLEREVKQEGLDNFKYKVDIFKRFLPFEKGYKGEYHLCANHKGKRIDIEIGVRASMKIDADEDFLMKICAYISELSKASE